MKLVPNPAALFLLTPLLFGCGGKAAGVTNIKVIPAPSRPVAKEADQEELLKRYNNFARTVNSVNATAELKATAGSEYSGVIDQYHEVKAFLLAEKPAKIRVIGQVPVIGTGVFDMASDGQEFEVFIPSKNQFLDGQVSLERQSNNPIENLRPQHLVDALLWPEIEQQEVVLFEEFNDESGRFYVLTVLRGGYKTEILRKVWFDRADLNVTRLERFGPKGALLSDVHFADWQAEMPNGSPSTSASSSGLNPYPRKIRIERPRDEYQLDLTLSRVTLNEALDSGQFRLEPPAGAIITHLNENTGAQKP